MRRAIEIGRAYVCGDGKKIDDINGVVFKNIKDKKDGHAVS